MSAPGCRPADLYAGVPAPKAGERLLLWVQNSHPVPIPAGGVGANLVGAQDVAWWDGSVPPFGTVALDLGRLLPQAKFPDQIEIQPGRYFVRPRYEIVQADTNTAGRRRIAHANVERIDLKANPGRSAVGAVVEAKMERGRGSVATLLVQKGTLKVGDIFVAGSEWGRVRALLDDRGRNIETAGPATPVEVLGLQGTPQAGDVFVVVESEARAREITEFRLHREREKQAAAGARSTLEQMFSKIQAGEAKEVPVVIKADVQGSVEAIVSSLNQLATDEVKARVLHAAVGGVNESDITLARASGGMIIGFNVRANPQAREMAKRDHVDIRYYSIIYNVVDDIKAAMSGMLAPTLREKFLGNAEIREIFNITKTGKVADCMVTEGMVKRGGKVRLLRDNVVIHEGTLKTLRRFKDEVREVKEGFECGMAFENYDNIEKGDVIECFEMEEIARALA